MSVNDPLAAQADLDSLFLPDDYSPEVQAMPEAALPSVLGTHAVDASAQADLIPDAVNATPLAAQTDDAIEPQVVKIPDNLNWADVTAEFDAISRNVALATGRLDFLREREAARVLEVSEAKGRAGFRPEVEDVLEKLQHEAHERSVGAFEKMLTAIAQDVQPISPITIKLELTTERNMPALDIYGEVRRPAKEGEKPEDYVKREDLTSGALANVVSTGLRFITLARSGHRRFLVLDEADCWIETKDVQNFFNVVNQLSRDAGIQTVIITHHDLSAFEEDFRIYRINEIESKDEWKHRMPELVSQGRMTPSELQHDVLSFVEARNFEAYTKAHIDLAPGVTAITGINRGSKSAWARMFRAAFLGEGSDSNIRHGQTATKVAVGFSDGRVLEYNRRKRGTPKADFIMHTPESWEFSRDNPTWLKDASAPKPYHNSPVAKTPQWVPVETGVGLIDDVNVQLWGQFTPVFMLDQPATKRASLLSIGRESGYLFAMTELNKDDINNDNKLIRDGEKEIFSLRANMEPYADFSGLKAKIEALQSKLQELVLEDRWLYKGAAIIESLEKNRVESAYLAQWKDLEKILPSEPALSPTVELSTWLERVQEAKDMQAGRTDARIPSLPELALTTPLKDLVQGLQVAKEDARLKGKMPDVVQIPEVASTRELRALVADLAIATENASMKGKMPEIPQIPDIAPTTRLQDFVERLATASVDKDLPIIEMPAMTPIKRTEKLEQWAAEIDQANIDRKLPRIEIPALPALNETQALASILSEAQRISVFLNTCRAQSIVLNGQFEGVQSLLEKASKALGFNAFELPADVAEALAEGAVLSHEPGGSRDKVVAYFDTLKEQIQVAARKGYVHAMETNLDLPGGFLERGQFIAEVEQAVVKRSPRP